MQVATSCRHWSHSGQLQQHAGDAVRFSERLSIAITAWNHGEWEGSYLNHMMQWLQNIQFCSPSSYATTDTWTTCFDTWDSFLKANHGRRPHVIERITLGVKADFAYTK